VENEAGNSKRSCPKSPRLNRAGTDIELDFEDAVHTPIEIMEHAIQLHLAGLSLNNTVIALEQFGISLAKSTIHTCVQKADLEPRGGSEPDNVALDETAVKIEGEQYWFVAAVEPSKNRIPTLGSITGEKWR
jgi:putative transposase